MNAKVVFYKIAEIDGSIRKEEYMSGIWGMTLTSDGTRERSRIAIEKLERRKKTLIDSLERYTR
tara:strand:+ start:69846 stop:70037 length:192 start_codon:yes stop_codon:yes gene_type:complete